MAGTPPNQLASTFQAAQQGGPAPMLWKDYQNDLAPPWLQAGQGGAWLRALGDMKDELELRAKDAVKMRMPLLAPADALARLADERGLPQGPSESLAAWAARLQQAWATWQSAGNVAAVLNALMLATGYTTTGAFYILQNNNLTYYCPVSGLPGYGTFTTAPQIGGFWNSCLLLFAASSTITGTDMLLRIAALWKKWAPAHARLESISYGTGHIWGPAGMPAGATWNWGAGTTWGSTETTWINPNP